MGTVEIALAISILVVLVLVVSCWKGKKPRRRSYRRAAPREDDSGDLYDDLPRNQRASYGSAVVSRKLRNQYEDLSDMSAYDDYSDVVQVAGLESEVYDSHNRYTKDINGSTTGASNMSVRSDDNDVVNWVGLRRPNYHAVYAAADARVDHSQYVDQMPRRTSSYVL